MQSSIIVQSLGFTNNKTDKILEFKNRGIKAAAGTVMWFELMKLLAVKDPNFEIPEITL